ncbi:hypothetical protein HY630_00600 [Candidatus Uhrbacteria bacterium]|nr:hypothetical protein [Candidatus Uhrbacteria bacterium]
MKKAAIVIIVLLIALVAVIFLMRPSSDASDSSGTSESGSPVSPPAEEGSQSKTDEARRLLGIDLPDDATVSLILDNDQAAVVQGQTDLPLSESRSFFASEMQNADYAISRDWGESPADSATLQSSSFTGSGETWIIILRTYEGYSTFDIQRQY